MIFYLNSADHSKVIFGVKKSNEKYFFEERVLDREKKDMILLNLDGFFKKYNLDFFQLKGIVVCVGPGSFSRVRIGVTIANTFGMVFQIPVKGITVQQWKETAMEEIKNFPKKFHPVVPFYHQEPNITLKKYGLSTF